MELPNKIAWMKDPWSIQQYIDGLIYNARRRMSPLNSVLEGKADCFEAALIAVACLRHNGIRSFLIDLTTIRDEDHVLAAFEIGSLYGAIAKSKYLGLKFRNPAYRTVRELVMSYFDHCFNLFGELTLRSYAIHPLKLQGWFDRLSVVRRVERELDELRHFQLFSHEIRFPRIGRVRLERETMIPKK